MATVDTVSTGDDELFNVAGAAGWLPGEADLLKLPFPFLLTIALALVVVRCTAGPFKCSFFLAIRLNLTMIRIFKMVRVTMGPSLNKVSLTHK